MSTRTASLVLFLLALAAPAHAQGPPDLLHFQARLADATGAPVTGAVALRAYVYDDPVAGTLLWSETHSATAMNGVVNLLLGSLTPFPADLFAQPELHLTLSVQGDPEMTPRLRIASVAFARRAAAVSALDSATQLPDDLIAADHIQAGAVGAAEIAPGAVGASELASGAVDTDALGTKVVTGTNIATGAVDTAHLAGGAVGTSQIAIAAVTSSRIADGAVGGAQLGGDAVDTFHIAPGAVGSSQLATSAVTGPKIALDSVRSGNIVDLTVSSVDLANGAVTSAKIQDGAVTAADLAPGAVNGTALATAAVLDEHISPATKIAGTKIIPSFGANVTTPGDIGVGTSSPLANAHVARNDLGLSQSLQGDELMVEADDAAIGVYSGPGGSAGSLIALNEIENGALNDVWALARETGAAGGGLRFTFGTDAAVFGNPTALYLEDTLDVGVGTLDPVADLHVVGSSGLGEIMISPDESVSGEDSQLFLAEDDDGSHGMRLRYRGDDNELVVEGKSGTLLKGPHLKVHRDTGEVTVPGTLRNPAVPIAFGSVDEDGNIEGGSGNWSVALSGSRYQITVNGHSPYTSSRYLLIAQPHGYSFSTSTTYLASHIEVEFALWLTGAPTPSKSDFGFVVYEY